VFGPVIVLTGDDGILTGGGCCPMFERLEAELSMLLSQMENQPQDRHELYLMLQEKLGEMRAFGMPIPEDILELERQLDEEFSETKN
jgi:hypothetical protein